MSLSMYYSRELLINNYIYLIIDFGRHQTASTFINKFINGAESLVQRSLAA